MDGYVTIGTRLDTKDLESGIRKAETELNRLDKEAKKLTDQKVTLEADNSELQQTIDKYDTLVSKAENYQRELRQLETSGQLWSSSYDTTKAKLEQVTSEINRQEKGMLKAGEQIDRNNQKLEAVNKKLKDNASNQDIVNAKIEQMNSSLSRSRMMDGIKSSIDGIKTKMSGIVKGAIQWGLAIFSIRSAYSFLTSSLSTLSQYNQQMAVDVEYIRWALAMTLKPVIEFIIKLAYQLLGILRYIIKLLFNYDIFANAGTKAFQKAKENTGGISNNLGSATKKAKALNKELNKQLTTFDEMNILGDNVRQAGDTGSGGVGGGTSGASIPMPSMEIPEIKDIKIDWGNILKNFEKGIDMVFKSLGISVDNFFGDIGRRFYNNASGWTAPLSNTFGDFFVTLGKTARLSIEGIGDVFRGLVMIVRGIFTGDLPTIAEGFMTTFVGIFKMGLGSIGSMLNVLATPFRLAFNTALQIAQNFFNWLAKQTGIKAIKWDNLMVGLGNVISKIKTKLTTLKNDIPKIFKNIGTKVGNAVQTAFKYIFNKMISSVESRLNKPIDSINTLVGYVNKLLPKSKRISKLNRIHLPRLAQGGIINQPGRGVMVGSAIAGERGAEGVIPLTDSQQMALLGEAIGRYITINANITNNMNGRVISRELQRIQNDDNFAYNR